MSLFKVRLGRVHSNYSGFPEWAPEVPGRRTGFKKVFEEEVARIRDGFLGYEKKKEGIALMSYFRLLHLWKNQNCRVCTHLIWNGRITERRLRNLK